MPTTPTSPWVPSAATSSPRGALVRAALLGSRDLLRAALEAGPESEGAAAAEVALAAVEAALAQHQHPRAAPARAVEPAVDRRAHLRVV